MIANSNISLPYPVIGLEGDFKEGQFSVKPTIQIRGNELHVTEDSIEITNNYINELFNDGEITTAYRIVCSSTLFSKTVINEKHFIIPLNLLSNYIILEVFLVTQNKINNYSDETFNDDYKLGNNKVSFEVEKGNIIGFAGSVKIPLKKTWVKGATSMFKFNRGEDVFVSFDVESGDKIEITYPFDNSQEWDITLHMSKSNSMTFLNLFIVPALNRAFLQLIREEEFGTINEFLENHEWALILTETYSDWRNEDTYGSAQKYLKNILELKGKLCKIPILEAFDEIKRR